MRQINLNIFLKSYLKNIESINYVFNFSKISSLYSILNMGLGTKKNDQIFA